MRRLSPLWMALSSPALLLLAALLFTAPGTRATPADGASLPQTHLRRVLQTPSAESSSSGDCCAALAAIGFTSSLPVVVLTSTKTIPHKVDTPVQVCTCNNGADFEDYSGPASAAGRGSSSAFNAKKSYKVELKGPDGKGVDFPFLGMPEHDEWILYGPELERSFLPNYIAYNLARASGQYASRTVFTEVFLVEDGQPLSMKHYNGLYIGEESVKRGKNRVDVAKLDPADLSGGYLFVYDNDNIEEGDVTFGPAAGWDNPFVVKYPKEIPDGGAYLLKYINDFQSALEASDWLQRSGNNSYTSFIDGPAFTDYFLLTELTKNPDGYRGSTYMHKDKGGVLAMGPAWDYNEAFGECCGYPVTGWDNGGQSGPGVSGGSAISPEGWRFNICDDPERCLVEPKDGTSRWYRRMWSDPRFRTAVTTRWEELRAGPWSDTSIKTLIGDAENSIADAAVRNYEKYPEILGAEGGSIEQAWKSQVDTLEGWLLKHVAWIDGAVKEAAAEKSQVVSTSGR